LKIAVPLFENRIAPRLCFAREILFFSIDAEKKDTSNVQLKYHTENTEKIIEIDYGMSFLDLTKWLKNQAVDIVLCCGINRQASYLLQAMGIEVVQGLTGEARQVIEDFLANPCRGQWHGAGIGYFTGTCLGPMRRRRRGREFGRNGNRRRGRK